MKCGVPPFPCDSCAQGTVCTGWGSGYALSEKYQLITMILSSQHTITAYPEQIIVDFLTIILGWDAKRIEFEKKFNSEAASDTKIWL